MAMAVTTRRTFNMLLGKKPKQTKTKNNVQKRVNVKLESNKIMRVQSELYMTENGFKITVLVF